MSVFHPRLKARNARREHHRLHRVPKPTSNSISVLRAGLWSRTSAPPRLSEMLGQLHLWQATWQQQPAMVSNHLHSFPARLQQDRVHDLNQIGGLQQELASLKAEVERLTDAITRGACIPDAKAE